MTIQELLAALLQCNGVGLDTPIEVLLSDDAVASPSRLLRPLHIEAVRSELGVAYMEIS